MIPILRLLQTSVVLYMIVLTTIWTFVQISSRVNSKKIVLNTSKRAAFVILMIYMLLTILFINTNINYFPYLHAMTLVFMLMTILCSSKYSLRLLFVTIIALMPILVMVSTKHPLPLGDDARFIGFAKAIAEDGYWIPFKYAENTYYQFFHLIPHLEYTLAVISGFYSESISAYYLTLKLCFYFAYLSLMYLIMKKLTSDEPSPLVATLLLSITPPLALVQVTQQRYAVVLFLATILLLLQSFKNKQSTVNMLATFPLIVAGIVAHATYTIMVMAFIIPFIMASERWVKNSISLIAKFLTLLISISLVYWTYTYVLDLIVRPTVNAVERLIDLLTGRAIYSTFQGTAKPWYTSEMSIFFISWTLIPSIVASYAILSLVLKAKRHIRFWSSIEMLGLIGLGGTVLNYILRTLPTFGGRYFYWLYILMLPLSALTIRKTSGKLLSLILSLTIISLVSFYGIQDPTISANTYGDYIGWADRTSWEIAKGLTPYINPEIRIWLDPRLGAPASSLTSPPLLSESFNAGQVVAIISEDSIGLHAMNKDPRNVNFFKRYFDIDPNRIFNNLNNLNVIYKCRSYYGVTKR
mgnify:CR=1 FL=1